jgi:hypothetical protein
MIKEINKNFLANTISSVEAHNRREVFRLFLFLNFFYLKCIIVNVIFYFLFKETDNCWRQLNAIKKGRSLLTSEETEEKETRENIFVRDREYWSNKKVKLLPYCSIVYNEFFHILHSQLFYDVFFILRQSFMNVTKIKLKLMPQLNNYIK